MYNRGSFGWMVTLGLSDVSVCPFCVHSVERRSAASDVVVAVVENGRRLMY